MKKQIIILFLLLKSTGIWAQCGIINTVAGTGSSGYGGDGSAATAAQFSFVNGIAMDRSGNLYISDGDNYRVRKVSASGVITTVAGDGSAGFGGDGGAATAAQLSAGGIAVDGSGNLYLIDQGRIRMVSASGTITTIAGTGSSGFSGDGGAATAAQLYAPSGVAVDGSGNIYIADYLNQRIRMIRSGVITTIAGTGTAGYSGDGGAATAAQLNYPECIAVDSWGNVYVGDYYNSRIRKISVSGVITTCAGTGAGGCTGDGGPATAAHIQSPHGIAFDRFGNMYISDVANNKVRMVNTFGIITTIAGITYSGLGSYSGDGGAATAARLNIPEGVAADDSGNVYIADYRNYRIRRVNAPFTPSVTSITGGSSVCTSGALILTDSTTSGSWSSVYPSLATITSSGVVTGLSAGIDTIKYSITNSCGTTVVTKVVAVNPLPYASSISGAAMVCVGSTIALTDTVSGGTWSSVYLSLATVNLSGVVTGLSAGIDTIKYSVTNGCGTATAGYAITVNGAPGAGVISGPDTVCLNDTIVLTSSVSGGTWIATNAHALVSGTGATAGLAIGADTILYSVTGPCGADTAMKTVYVSGCSTEVRNAALAERTKIFPNPAGDYVIVESAEPVNIVNIYNLLGQRVYAETTNRHQLRINISNLLTGLYVLEVNAAEKIKLIKQ